MAASTLPRVAVTPMPRAWVEAMPAKYRTINSTRIAAKRGRLFHRDGNRCFYCQRSLGRHRPPTVDHLIPNHLVRSWSIRNLVLACDPCNTAKGGNVPDVLMPLLSALVLQLARLNAAPVERSLVLVGGA